MLQLFCKQVLEDEKNRPYAYGKSKNFPHRYGLTVGIGMPMLRAMNWTEIIADLRSAGHTQAQIADEIKVTQATISDLATGVTKTPRWETGSALLAMHKRVMRARSKSA